MASILIAMHNRPCWAISLTSSASAYPPTHTHPHSLRCDPRWETSWDGRMTGHWANCQLLQLRSRNGHPLRAWCVDCTVL